MKYFTLIVLFSVLCSNAQLEQVSEIIVGSTASGQFTNQPVSPQSELSHSQTIYYPEQLQFRGEINEIRFFKAFSGATTTNLGDWTVRLGYTDKEEFTVGDPFVDVSTLTEVSTGGYDTQGIEVIISLETPFYYDGLQNIILDVQDNDPGFTTSATAGYRGVENFNNPPTRSLITFSHMGNGSALYENSYATTQFGGNLERCPQGYSFVNGDFDETTANFEIINSEVADGYRYIVTSLEDDEPDPFATNFQVVTGNFTVNNLFPAQDYRLWYKADCDEVTTRYFQRNFRTAAIPLSVPTIIDFETPSGNYYLNENFGGFLEVNAEAALDGSAKGLLLNGSDNFNVSNQWSNNNIWVNNSEFISRVEFDVDLTQNAVNPVFQFDLQQRANLTYLRMTIDDIIQEFEYHSDDVAFDMPRTIAFDLSDYVGERIILEFEHLARSDANKSFIDNIRLIETTCDEITNVTFETEENSITLNWESPADFWELAILEHNERFDNSGATTSSTSFTFDNLEIATAYDIYIRSICSDGVSSWTRLFKSTASEIISEFPYENNFAFPEEINSDAYVLELNRNSRIARAFNDRDLYLTQIRRAQGDRGWTGGVIDVTESQAWNDNSDYISSVSFRIDATNLLDLEAIITYKQLYFYTPNTSWFRILVNGEQVGPSYNPETIRSDPFTDLVANLDAFVGEIITVTLQQSGLDAPGNSVSSNTASDMTVISAVSFDGEEDVLGIAEITSESFTLYPNPATSELNIISQESFVSAEIYDARGALVSAKILSEQNVNVSNLPSGLYFIILETPEGIRKQKHFLKI